METPTLPTPEAPPGIKRFGGLGVMALATVLFLCGLCSAAFYIILPLTEKNSASSLETNTVFGAMAGLGLFFGVLLAWQGVNIYCQRETLPAARIFPPVLAFALALLGAIFLGFGALSLKAIAVYAFPPWHFLAATLIPLVFLAYAARRLGIVSGLRALVISFSWGALGATLLALIAEVLVGAVIALIALVVLSSTPAGQATLGQIRSQITRLPQDATQLNQLLASPGTATIFFLYFAILVPPIEEAVKTLVVAFIDPRRTREADAVLWGIGAGAGFAAFENLFNTAALLNAWLVVIVMRFGATTMHIANGVIMGRGWYAARVERRWSRWFIAYAGSVFFHAIWNGSVILLSQSALALSSDPGAAVQKLFAQGALMVSLMGVIGILTILGWVWIAYATRTAQKSLQAIV